MLRHRIQCERSLSNAAACILRDFPELWVDILHMDWAVFFYRSDYISTGDIQPKTNRKPNAKPNPIRPRSTWATLFDQRIPEHFY